MTDAGGQSRNQLNRKFEMVWDALRELGIKLAVVEFSGSGDSGQIDDCYPVGSDNYAAFGARTLAFDPDQPFVLLRNVIIELSDVMLQKHEIPDWYTNDGGYGQIEWSVADTDKEGIHRSDRIAVAVNVAVVEYDTSNFEYGGFGNRLGVE